ncbi:GIY-YIG nuclease family protein [Brasilonema sp. CT11]|nr:GIY-YIG nuclease family protein [Brasilonema sp. CT11]
MAHFNSNQWVERNDNQPGFIYLIEAIGVNGWIPGCVVKRYKIGLSRNPEARLTTFHANQPPVDMRIVRTIYVEDMKATETALHKEFKHCNVKLVKSREFFDLNPINLARVHWAMTRHETRVWSFADVPKRAVAGGLVALLGVGLMIGYGLRATPQPRLEPIPELKPLPELKKPHAR